MSLLRRASNIKTVTRRLPLAPRHGLGNSLYGLSNSTSTMEQEMRAYGEVGWLFAVVTRIAEAVSMNPWECFQDLEGPPIKVPAHPLAQLWDAPNPFYTRQEFIMASEQYYRLVGESWWVLITDDKTGLIKEIWPVRPDRMHIVKSNEVYIAGYVYKNGTEEVPLSIDDVIHIKNHDPLDPYRGRGVVKAILSDLEGEEYAALWNRNFFINSAEPGGIIEYPDTLSPEEWENITLRWREQHQGVANAHRVAIIEGGQWKDRKMTQRDMQFGDLRRINRDTILGAFGVPMPVLGITEAVNRANAESGEYLFAKWIVKPSLERYKQKLNAKIAKRYGEGISLDFKDPVPPDPTVNLNTATVGYEKGLLSKNEGRKRLGENPVVDGDLDVLGNPMEIIEPDQQPYRPIERGYRLKSAELTIDREMSILWYEILTEEAQDLIKYLDVLYPEPKDTYVLAADKLLGYIGFNIKISSSDFDHYNWDWESKYGRRIEDKLAEIFEKVFNSQIEDNLPSPAPSVIHSLARTYANHRMIDILSKAGTTSIVSTTRNRIWEILENSQESTVYSVKEKITSDHIFSVDRAKKITRTETSYITGLATWKCGVLQGKTEKRWITVGDDSSAQDCVINEKSGWIPISTEFPSGDQTTPEHQNCRCIIETRLGDEEEVTLASQKTMTDNSEALNVRCPDCNHRLPVSSVSGKASIYCRHCRNEVEVTG